MMRIANVPKAQPGQAEENRRSPAGTVELSPGRSPGFIRRGRKVPKGRLEGWFMPTRLCWNSDRGMRVIISAVPAGLFRKQKAGRAE
jgi:hypothetical protein